VKNTRWMDTEQKENAMATLSLGPQDQIYYEHTSPATKDGYTFVFFNALTGDTSAWESIIGPELRKAGHGTLVYNFRGQVNSPFSPGIKLDSNLIVSDTLELLAATNPSRPILVGLSIGGLFAARTWLQGGDALGLVFINTLRRDGPRLQWIGDALVRAVEVGGLDLFRDLFLPLLMNEDWLLSNRPAFLKQNSSYTALDPDSGHYKLLAEAGRTADWDLPYEQLTLPVLVITGLQDHVFLETDIVTELFKRLPQARRMDMPEAGHLIPGEHPDILCKALLSFAGEVR